MRARVAAAVAMTVLTGVALSGCTSTAKGTPTPLPDTSRPSEESGVPPTTESDQLVPPVKDPKNMRGVDPCQMLTAAQLTELTFTDAGEKDISLFDEEACTFTSPMLIITLEPDTKRRGLEETYQRENNFDNFEESSVDGYPAARIDAGTQICTAVVGVADDQALNVDLTRVRSQAPGLNDPCGLAEEIAGMVLKNLPAA